MASTIGGSSAVLYQRNGHFYNQWRLMRQDDIAEITMSGEYISDDDEIARRWAFWQGWGLPIKLPLM